MTERSTKPVWAGRFFEDFAVGDVFKHALGRIVNATDNSWFTLLTQNTAPLHFDANYAAQTSFGRPLVNSSYLYSDVLHHNSGTNNVLGDTSFCVY